MDMILAFVVSRMKERSTWLGLVGILSSFGVALQPEYVEAIASIGVALSGVVLVLTRDLTKEKIATEVAKNDE